MPRLAACIAAVVLLLSGCSSRPPGPDTLRIAVVDLGEADCTLLQTNSAAILVDSGETDSGPDIVRFLRSKGVRRIDLAVLTHQHSDHIGGLPYVGDRIPIALVLAGQTRRSSGTLDRVVSWITANGVPVRAARSGQQISVGDLAIDVLWPKELGTRLDYPNPNNNSVVLRVKHGTVHLLLVGDLESEAEQALIRSGVQLRADLLKVGHQGSRTSSSPEFLAKVKPAIAAISVGKDNSYGHPAVEVVKRLNQNGAAVYMTSLHGDLVFESDGRTLRRVR